MRTFGPFRAARARSYTRRYRRAQSGKPYGISRRSELVDLAVEPRPLIGPVFGLRSTRQGRLRRHFVIEQARPLTRSTPTYERHLSGDGAVWPALHNEVDLERSAPMEPS